MEEINYLSLSNNAKILSCSSQAKSCGASNVLSNDRKTIWLSETGLPQHLIIDITQLTNKPKEFKCFGIYCWHAYNTNPKLIELYFSKDNKSYVYFGKFTISLVSIFNKKKPGTQYFAIDPVDTSVYKSIKVVVKETYGGVKTYFNQIYLYEDIPEVDNKKSINESKKSFSTNSRQTGNIKKVPRDLKNELLPDHKKEENELINDKNFNTDSEDSLHNMPQKMYNIQDISRISRDAKQVNKKEVNLTYIRVQSFENSKNYSISIKKEKNIELDEKGFDGISLNSHSLLNNNNNKANSIDQHLTINKINKNEKDSNNKTLEDQLKEMENHLMKLKLDQSSDNALKSVLNHSKLKNNTIPDDKFTREKEKEDFNTKYNNLTKGNFNISSFNTKENIKLYIGDDLKRSNSNYSILTNKLNNYNNNNDDKIAKLEKELSDVKNKYENLQQEIDILKKSKANLNEKSIETILTECKKYIDSLIKSKPDKASNSYKTANYNNINDKNNNIFHNNTSNFLKNNLNYSSDNYINTENRNEENFSQKNITEKIEKNLYKIIEGKFDTLAKTIEEKVNNSILKPSITNIEKNLKSNIEELRDKINSISSTQNKISSNNRQNYINKEDSDVYEPDKSLNNKSKLENIQTIAEKLHEKLTEKEKKLALLQQQTNYYLKEKKNLLSSPISNISDNY